MVAEAQEAAEAGAAASFEPSRGGDLPAFSFSADPNRPPVRVAGSGEEGAGLGVTAASSGGEPPSGEAPAGFPLETAVELHGLTSAK